MSFNWDQYLDLASELAGKPPKTPSTEEARLRSAISRAYYAAFCRARNELRDQRGVVNVEKMTHKQLWKRFETADTKDQQIASDGDRLRRDRNAADYDDVIENLSSVANSALELSAGIIDRLGRHS